MRQLQRWLVASQHQHRTGMIGQRGGGAAQAARQAAAPLGVVQVFRVQVGAACADGSPVRAQHHHQPHRRGVRGQAHGAMDQGFAVAHQQLLGPSQAATAAGRQHYRGMCARQIRHGCCRIRCNCAAMLSAMASGPCPPRCRPTGECRRGCNAARAGGGQHAEQVLAPSHRTEQADEADVASRQRLPAPRDRVRNGGASPARHRNARVRPRQRRLRRFADRRIGTVRPVRSSAGAARPAVVIQPMRRSNGSSVGVSGPAPNTQHRRAAAAARAPGACASGRRAATRVAANAATHPPRCKPPRHRCRCRQRNAPAPATPGRQQRRASRAAPPAAAAPGAAGRGSPRPNRRAGPRRRAYRYPASRSRPLARCRARASAISGSRQPPLSQPTCSCLSAEQRHARRGARRSSPRSRPPRRAPRSATRAAAADASSTARSPPGAASMESGRRIGQSSTRHGRSV